jgi:hypothetical protein
MLTSPRAFGVAVLCLAGLAAHAPALADQWRIEHATVIELDDGVGEPAVSPLHLGFSYLAAPFQDGQYPKSSSWYDVYRPVINGVNPKQARFEPDRWQLTFQPDNGAAPSVDLANMQASFASLELDQIYVDIGMHGVRSEVEYRMAALGLDDPVKLTALGDGRYQASWDVRGNVPGGSAFEGDPLYAVSLTFIHFPEGTPWSYAPVPEPDSVFMALGGLGAVGWARRRQLQRLAA